MSASANDLPFEPLFLAATPGKRFAIHHPAAGAPRGSVVYLHPFAEEMNKSRRMAALQSRALAARGLEVLQIDLYGCGDSDGDFGDARWEIWKRDVSAALGWIAQRGAAPVYLWGLRLGALLACDCATVNAGSLAGLVLWQPVLSGEQFLTQFLRLRVAGDMLGGADARAGTRELRERLGAGNSLEVAGYEIASELACAIDGLQLAGLAPRGVPVDWFEIVPSAQRPLPPAASRVVQAWAAGGAEPRIQLVPGPQFWTTPEITECAELVALTTGTLTGARNGV